MEGRGSFSGKHPMQHCSKRWGLRRTSSKFRRCCFLFSSGATVTDFHMLALNHDCTHAVVAIVASDHDNFSMKGPQISRWEGVHHLRRIGKPLEQIVLPFL